MENIYLPYIYEMDAVPETVTNVMAFYLVGKLASELPNEDSQPSAALYRAVCEGDVCATKLLLESGHNPNLPYYFPGMIIDNDYRLDCIGRCVEDERGMFHYPLHRAVLLSNVQLVGLLLEYGADPNALDGRSNSSLAALVKSPIGIRIDVNEWSFGNNGKKECHVTKVLLRHGADMTEISLLNMLNMCCWSWDKETAHEVIGELLDNGCDSRDCFEIVTAIVNPGDAAIRLGDTITVRALIILFQTGFDVDCDMLAHIDCLEKSLDALTPLKTTLSSFYFRLLDMDRDARNDNCSLCRETDSVELCRLLSRAWSLVKTGAQVKTEGEDTTGKLASMEMTLSTIYDQTRDDRDRENSLPYGYALILLQYCKDVLKWISQAACTVRSLFDLSALAVRKSLGWNAGHKVTKLALPGICQDAVLLREIWPELWSFVETTDRCGRLFLYEKRCTGDCQCPYSPRSDISSDSEED